jgi:hypothetical protein
MSPEYAGIQYTRPNKNKIVKKLDVTAKSGNGYGLGQRVFLPQGLYEIPLNFPPIIDVKSAL